MNDGALASSCTDWLPFMTLSSLLIDGTWTPSIVSMINSVLRVSGGESLSYYIEDQSIAADDSYIEYVQALIGSIDALIDLDFVRTYDWQDAFYDINLYDKNPDDESNVVGEVNTRADNLQVVVFMRGGPEYFSSDRNTFLHEFLHGLALGEPGANPHFDQTDTALSYNIGDAADWQNHPTAADVEALIQLWGVDDDSSSSSSSVSLVSDVGRLYSAAFGRAPDAQGLSYWNSLLEDNIIDYQGVSKLFVASSEFVSRFGSQLTNQEFIEQLYFNVLGRFSDDAGMQYWSGVMAGNGLSRADLLIQFADSDENILLYNSLV